MKYPQLTVFNYKIAYYALRIFTIYWLVVQYLKFTELGKRPKEIYEPVFWLEKVIFPEFPGAFLSAGLIVSCGILVIASAFRPSYIMNILIFLLTALINLPLSANFGVHHDNHLIILAYFLSIFLLPKDMEDKDYKLVQYFYLGILATYTLAGLGKFLGTAKNIIKHTAKLTWLDKNAAKLNTYDSYWTADMIIPEWMKEIYIHENFWVLLTVVGIFLQFSCFLGAFNRKLLTFFMVFLYIFHTYTAKFVLADFENTNYLLIVLFFPYHILLPLFKRKEAVKVKN
ncbi:MAG: hypothetical protein MUW56_15125 [Chryseobacterium sp.]|uniref:hypothetical protein n=1 Tax=Chryseobacterium sp. TaxID=1871047 RepID=UPI0025B95364|nr:hypothetical protein [Chryseobacterium sp.]MCJ7934908.1 hypothetical protein [Chryseobacterium sp.]